MPEQTLPNDIERVDSGSGSVTLGADGIMAREVELKFLVHSQEGATTAEQKGRELAPLIYDGHRRTSLTFRALAGGWYEISATYANQSINAFEGAVEYENDDGIKMIPIGLSVDTTGGTEHITQAWTDSNDEEAYVAKYPADDAPRTWGAINVSGNQVNGVDITVPAFQLTETWLVPADYLLKGQSADNKPYAQQLRDMTGIVNKEPWRCFAIGEVLFLGARFDVATGQTMVPVTYTFSIRKSQEEKFQVGGIDIDFKDGWDYLWIIYENEVDDQRFMVKRPKYVIVDRIYERRDFAELHIGDKWEEFWFKGGEEFAHPMDPDKNDVT